MRQVPRLAGCLLTLTLTLLCGQNAEAAPSAAEVARHEGELRRIEARFVDEVAAVVGVPPGRIARLLPGEPHIADRGRRLVQAIGKEIRPLGPEEAERVLQADQRRRDALTGLR